MVVRIPRVGVALAAGAGREVGVAARALADGPAEVDSVGRALEENVDLFVRGTIVVASCDIRTARRSDAPTSPMKNILRCKSHEARKPLRTPLTQLTVNRVRNINWLPATRKISRRVRSILVHADDTPAITRNLLGNIVQPSVGIGCCSSEKEEEFPPWSPPAM